MSADDRPERKAFSDPMLAEALREFEGATVVEIREAPKRRPGPDASPLAPGAADDKVGEELEAEAGVADAEEEE